MIHAMRFRSVVLLVALLFYSGAIRAQRDAVAPPNALQHYLATDDGTYGWEIKDSLLTERSTIYQVLLTSQQWREFTWKHQLNIVVPNMVKHDGALLFISSGRMQRDVPSEPEWHDLAGDGMIQSVARMAEENGAVAALLRQVPNQPLYGGMTEDELISYTLHQFQKDTDYTWPLLFPMVKSAVKAMDAVQDFVGGRTSQAINRFVVTGLSKRGWTTWLTAAQDDRVEALAPMVIDILNMPVNLNYQIEVWQEYSPQIQDYVALGLVQDVESERGQALAEMIDPYAYRALLDKPKMLFMGTNDQYWVIDAVKHYIDSIPGENYIHYVPNEGHSLGDKTQAFRALSAFWGFTLHGQPYPELTYEAASETGHLIVDLKATPARLIGAKLWYAASDDQDFRDERWRSRDLDVRRVSRVVVTEPAPAKGYKACYVDLIYEDVHGEPYTQSTRVFVGDQGGFFLN